MSTTASDHQEKRDPQPMMIPIIAVIGEIIVNCYIIWFLLINVPSRCTQLVTETGERQTCGLEAGSYIIASVSAVMILVGVYYLATWNFAQEE
jgi:hypothetical protein